MMFALLDQGEARVREASRFIWWKWSEGFDEQDPSTWTQDFAQLKEQGACSNRPLAEYAADQQGRHTGAPFSGTMRRKQRSWV